MVYAETRQTESTQKPVLQNPSIQSVSSRYVIWGFLLLLTDLSVITQPEFYATWKLHRSKNYMQSLRKVNEWKVSGICHTR